MLASWDNTPPAAIVVPSGPTAPGTSQPPAAATPPGQANINVAPGANPTPGLTQFQGVLITNDLGPAPNPSLVAQQGPGSLVPGTYYYALEVVGLLGQGSTGSAPLSITFSAPNNSVQLTWTAVAGASGYVLYRSASPTFTGNNRLPNMPVTALIHTDLGAALQAGTPPTAQKQPALFYATENGDHLAWGGQPGAGINLPPDARTAPAGSLPDNTPPGVNTSAPTAPSDNNPPAANSPPALVSAPDNNPPVANPVP